MHIVFRRSDIDVASTIKSPVARSATENAPHATVLANEATATESPAPAAGVAQGWIIFGVIGGVVLIVTVVVSVLIAKSRRRQRLEAKSKNFHHLPTSQISRRTYSRLSKRSMADRALDAEEQRSLMITKSLASRSGSISSMSITGSMKAESRSNTLKELEAGMYEAQHEQHPFWSPDIVGAELPGSTPARSRSSTTSSTASHPALPPPIGAMGLRPPPQTYSANNHSSDSVNSYSNHWRPHNPQQQW